MNEWMQVLQDAGVLHGELKRMYLGAGAVGIFVCACWAVQEWGARKSIVALGWFGVFCLAAGSVFSLLLLALGLV